MSDPIYAIPDIHGHLDALEHALRLVEADGGQDAEIVFLGDLVDRGPDSRRVLERLMQGLSDGRRWHVLMGNHDELFLRFLARGTVDHPRIKSKVPWTHPRLGGLETLASYGLDADENVEPGELFGAARDAVPADHVRFLSGLPRHLERGPLLFVHAGIRPGVQLAGQNPEDLIWIRDPFLDDPNPHPWLVVHGHTALERPRHFGNRIDLDGGTGYGRPIHPAVFEGRDCWLLTHRGREPLSP